MRSLVNPWKNMDRQQQRRVSSEINYDLFWIINDYGHYGFSIESRHLNYKQTKNIKLKGFDVFLENLHDTTRLYLILRENSEWQIFYWLCLDLINSTESIKEDNNQKLIPLLINKLKRWQEILQKGITKQFSNEKQMGLFGELYCIYQFALERNVKEAITAWVGCEADKQDFLFDTVAIEVKTKKSTAGGKIFISSLEQLHCDKVPLYLVVYSVTIADKGESVKDIIKKIKNLLTDYDIGFTIELERKLFEYGYIEGFNDDEFIKFIVDKEQAYLVNEDFPKIDPKNISPEIREVHYAIDLSHCFEYECSPNRLYQ